MSYAAICHLGWVKEVGTPDIQGHCTDLEYSIQTAYEIKIKGEVAFSAPL